MSTHEAISAFLDNEPFEPQALLDALADPDGRALLIDLLILQRLVQPSEVASSVARPAGRSPWCNGARAAVAAAVLLFTSWAGYQLGERSTATASGPPAPTQIVKAQGDWQEVGNGGLR